MKMLAASNVLKRPPEWGVLFTAQSASLSSAAEYSALRLIEEQ